MGRRYASIALALAALALPPAHAADGDGDGERAAKPEARQSGEDRNGEKEQHTESRAGDDLTTCKRDADGMRGPERSRFMTQCLKERK